MLDIVVAGLQKCATSSLYYQFKKMNCNVPIRKEEMGYYGNYFSGYKWVENRFNKFNKLYPKIEISVEYAYNVDSLINLYNDIGFKMAFFVVRRPSDRAKSAYWYYLQTGKTNTRPSDILSNESLSKDLIDRSEYRKIIDCIDSNKIPAKFIQYHDPLSAQSLLRISGVEPPSGCATNNFEFVKKKRGFRNYHLAKLSSYLKNYRGSQYIRDYILSGVSGFFHADQVVLPSIFERLDEEYAQDLVSQRILSPKNR